MLLAAGVCLALWGDHWSIKSMGICMAVLGIAKLAKES